MTIELPFNMDFVINLTYKCNLRCKMCTQYGKNYKEQAMEELDIEDWTDFLEQIEDVNPKPRLILMGGEPLLYKDFEKFFKTATTYKFPTHIITNGFYLDKFFPILKDTATNITISIDGLSNTHDDIRGKKGLFEKVVENIKLIDKAQKQGSKIKLRINHVMLPENIDNIVEFYKFFKDYDVDTFTFQHIQSSNDELNQISQKQWREKLNQDYCMGLIPKENYNLDENFANKIKENLNKFKCYCKNDNCFAFPALEDDELKDYYTNNNLDNLRKYMICTTPWTTPSINPNGDVSNCIANTIGNIKEDNFWNIWNNEKAQKLRDTLVKNGKFTVCAKCCNFYKGTFIPAPEYKITINNAKMCLPNELNYLLASKCIAFIKDNDRQQQNEYIPAIPINIHSSEALKIIEKEYEIITILN